MSAGILTGLLLGATVRPASAVDLPAVDGEPVTLDVTNTAIVSYHFDNRNDSRSNVGTLLDDHYGDVVERLNAQLRWWRLEAGLRLETMLFFAHPDLAEARAVAKAVDEADPEYPTQFYQELNTRFRSTLYPAKLWLSYTEPGLEITAGDFQAQLGRGLVLSVRKIDDLGLDTTIRGVKVSADHDLGPVRFATTALAGQPNPRRVDDITGRVLTTGASSLFFGFPQPRSVGYYRFIDPDPNDDILVREPVLTIDRPRPSYLEDTIVGGRGEVGNEVALVGVNGVLLLRKSFDQCASDCASSAGAERDACLADCGLSHPQFSSNKTANLHDAIRTVSATVSLPNLGKHGDLYLEAAGQQLRNGRAVDVAGRRVREKDLSGYALYASGTVRAGPVSLSLEGKHYRRFFALTANVDGTTKGFAAPEFETLTYSSPPTAEPIYVEPIGSPQVCNTGGRARLDYRFTPHVSLYGWLGRYTSFSEIDGVNNECSTEPEKRTDIWDGAIGADTSFEEGKSHAKLWIGLREDTRARAAVSAVSGLTSVFYREGYVRYDLTKHLGGAFALQSQGFHRRRYEPVSFEKPWLEGENYAGLQWSPHVTAIFGYEYTSKEGCEPGTEKDLCHYFSGGLQVKPTDDEGVLSSVLDTVTVFVGQRRGAIRCVSGVCRLFPPFEGAKLEVVSRF